MTNESEVPIDLQHTLTDADAEMNPLKAVELLPPEERPGCPECGEQLNVLSVGTDGRDNLTAARLMCHHHQTEHLYIYEAATGEVFFDGSPERVDMREIGE